MHFFERVLSISVEDIEFKLRGHSVLPWADFLLNPRRLRGSDFLMRWSQGAWSEDRLIHAINSTRKYFALPYGPSGVAPDNDVRAFELYFERLEAAGLGKIKRPDVLLFQYSDRELVKKTVEKIGGITELPFTKENDIRMKVLLSKAIIAIECENSLWVAKQMPNYGTELTPQKRLGGKYGLKKAAVLPTVIIKEEDRQPLRKWQNKSGVKIHIWHVFYDLAFGLPFNEAERLIKKGLILPTEQVFQAPGGATTKKAIYKYYYHYAYPLAESIDEPALVADFIKDKNGHILPYVKFKGGKLKIRRKAIDVLNAIATK